MALCPKMMSEMISGVGRRSHAVSEERGGSWLHTPSKISSVPLSTAMKGHADADLERRLAFTKHLLVLHSFESGHSN